MEGLTEGRIVHFVLADGPHAGEHRPAIVVKDWKQDNGLVNLVVFLDGSNDSLTAYKDMPMCRWATSVIYSEQPESGTWHWIERA